MEHNNKKLKSNAGKHRLLNLAINRVMVQRGKKALKKLDANSKNAVEIQKMCLMNLLEENKNTEYGKKYDFANIHSIEEYQAKVPFSEYSNYEPYIRRMIENGEDNLITSKEIIHYAISSGSIGVPKNIPVSQAEINKYSTYGPSMAIGVMDEYYHNTTGHSLKSGFGANMVEIKYTETPDGVSRGSISGRILKACRNVMEYFLQPPWEVINPQTDMNLKYLRARFILQERNITFLDGAFMTSVVDFMDYIKDNWEMLCKDIYHGRINKEIEIPEEYRDLFNSMLPADKNRARELVTEFKKGMKGIAPRIWPDLQFVGGIGTASFFTYSKRMKFYTGRNIPQYNLVYAASEGLVASARHPEDRYYVLIPDGGFYEFIPVKEGDDRVLTIEQLEEGEEYEIVFTNLSGFYRYRIGDVIRVMGFYNESPYIQFIYRKSQIISIAGEKTNEEAVRWSINQLAMETGLSINEYSIYANTDSEPGCYTFLIEPREAVKKDKIPEYRDILDQKMMMANPSYGEKVRTGVLSPAELKFLQRQTHFLYRDLMVMKGASANQLKPVRVIDTPIKEKFFFSLIEKEEFK